MTRPSIPLAEPDLRGAETAHLTRCIADNWISSAGPDVVAFERRLAALADRSHAVATTNGTSALYLALRVVGIGPGDLVAVPDWTFAATANAVLMAGAKPVFVDVATDTWSLCPDRLSAALDRFPAKAVMVVDALGHPADMDALLRVTETRGVPMIEDAAGALGSRYKGRPAGSFGTVAAFSFNGNKIVTTGGGGALLTDDAALAERARALSTQARSGPAYHSEEAGFNFRMPNLNAAVGLAQLDRLDAMVAAKRAIAARYDAAVADRSDIEPMPRRPWADANCWLYSVRCADRSAANDLIGHLERHGINARIFWEALSGQPAYDSYPATCNETAESLSGTVVSLPCSSHLTEEGQKVVIETLMEWRNQSASELGDCW